ncbi:MAG TPA: hypothetical protein VN203_26560, partial [Candidatus Acidoferrum sp.]|nr:hypothetical protein [Candidatus Acidoferrum sp.]
MMVTPHCSLQHAARLMTLIATSYGWQLAVGKEQSRVSRGSSVEDTFTPYHPGLLNILGKKMAPWLSRLLRSRSAVTVVGMLETYLAFLQGKGAGSGWDMQAEVGVALAHLSGPNPIIFDVGANDGDWSAQILKALGPNCRIIQFEPSPLCQEILQAQQSA